MNPTVVMTPMGKKAWSDPAKAGIMLSRIPLGRFVGKCKSWDSLGVPLIGVGPSLEQGTKYYILMPENFCYTVYCLFVSRHLDYFT